MNNIKRKKSIKTKNEYIKKISIKTKNENKKINT